MKNVIISCLFFSVVFTTGLNAQEYMVITTIESIMPMGIGRSRMITPKEKLNTEDFTSQRTGKKNGERNKSRRKDIKINKFEEIKMLNFYSAIGINFQNIASNDALITDKINDMAKEGWELAFVLGGVESDSGTEDGRGIFITRYIFKK